MLTNSDFSFDTMMTRFGEVVAYGHLEQIERAAGICPRKMIGIDPEARLAHAIRTQDSFSQQTDLFLAA